MQTQKHEFVRKPRKIISRDKNNHLGEHSAMNRQKSKETEQKKNLLENSPNKPHNLISNLRFQLTNLRQEVAKLSKKQNKQSNQHSQVKLQYDMRSPKEKREIKSYYFQNKKTHLPSTERNNSKSKLKTFSQSQSNNAQQVKKNEEIQKLKQKIVDFERRNDILMKSNDELTGKIKQMGQIFKEQYQLKIHQVQLQRDRSSKFKPSLQNDITINSQKQLIENKEHIESLNKKIQLIEGQNLKLKSRVQRYQKLQVMIADKQKEMLDACVTIDRLNLDIQRLRQENSIKSKVIEDSFLQIRKLNTVMGQKVEVIMKYSQNILFLENKIKQLQKNIQVYLKNMPETTEKHHKILPVIDHPQELQLKPKSQPQGEPKRRIKGKGDYKQLQEIIELQEKSIMNQQSDINYLQSQLRKASFLKIIAKNQNEIIQGLNEQIVRNNLDHLNKKYAILYK